MEFLVALGFVGIIVGVVLFIVGKIKKKKYYGGVITIVSLVLFIIALIAMPPTEEQKNTESAETPKEEIQKESSKPAEENTKAQEEAEEQTNKEDVDWKSKIKEIAENDDKPADKYYAVEKLMMEYKTKFNKDEIEKFKNDIINDYKSGNYLSELDNHERMLTNIFKSYIVERNSEGAVKDFAFDYHQNLKYTYRGVDTVNSSAVKSNERQMDKALKEMGK
ncbi:hypothetical protein CV945_11270 [Geobacillus sp. Manikaran-105]|uniref:hypothetical protein n=1 Tax=Geobacillus TaxID=129337 RepID=UPI000763E280|nr:MULTISPECIES: hypothetical protein [Geobacillus]ASS86284.1 hypothetical protein GLN3_03595 [Geobacillus lituanicus]PJW13963.1 hypothetical protein CV945_11270 [Geobacillus sp. Manikaran-105]